MAFSSQGWLSLDSLCLLSAPHSLHRWGTHPLSEPEVSKSASETIGTKLNIPEFPTPQQLGIYFLTPPFILELEVNHEQRRTWSTALALGWLLHSFPAGTRGPLLLFSLLGTSQGQHLLLWVVDFGSSFSEAIISAGLQGYMI